MGWLSGLAGAGLAVALAAHASAVEPGAAYGTFEGRDYFVVWPSDTPTRIVVYLHASGPQPLAYEARSGMLEALAADASSRGYTLLAPTAGKGGCEAAGASPIANLACWRLDAADEEIARLDRLIGFIERSNSVSFRTRDAVGYEVGADLLLASFAQGLLGRYGRLGLIDADPPASADQLSALPSEGPLIYLEAPQGDPAAAEGATALLRALVSAHYGTHVCTRGDPGDRRYDSGRLASFLAWFDVDCRAVAPVAPGSGGSSAVTIERVIRDPSEDPDGPRNVSERSGPRG